MEKSEKGKAEGGDRSEGIKKPEADEFEDKRVICQHCKIPMESREIEDIDQRFECPECGQEDSLEVSE